ncbi:MULTISPECIES: hypothetical protein [unclassified Bradyrhizobium]
MGPLTKQMMGDVGANLIKVEAPSAEATQGANGAVRDGRLP